MAPGGVWGRQPRRGQRHPADDHPRAAHTAERKYAPMRTHYYRTKSVQLFRWVLFGSVETCLLRFLCQYCFTLRVTLDRAFGRVQCAQGKATATFKRISFEGME